MKKRDKSLDFDQAYAELQQIVQAIQDENTPLETLEENIARAATLIAFCRERLRKTTEAVNRLIEE